MQGPPLYERAQALDGFQVARDTKRADQDADDGRVSRLLDQVVPPLQRSPQLRRHAVLPCAVAACAKGFAWTSFHILNSVSW